MINFLQGDITRDQADALVNTVNCVGFMGRGIALQFKKVFPENNRDYVAACKRQELQPGRMFVHLNSSLAGPRYIINFPTKRHWRGKSRLEDIELGLMDLVRVVQDLGVKSIAIPPLGAGLGGLDWREVRPLVVAAARRLPDTTVRIYEPTESPTPQALTQRPPPMTPGRATLIKLIASYLNGMMDHSVTLLEVHKLMYFAQRAGEPLRLTFVAGQYGPYAENLRHVLRAIDGHMIAGYGDGGDKPDKELSLVPGVLEEATEFITTHPSTDARFDRVAELVEGFESPVGLELLASVDWIASHGEAANSAAAVVAMHNWNERKRKFTAPQIKAAWDRLETEGWI